MSEVKISKENLIKSYNEADKATKKTLEAIFGQDMFRPKNIMARVRTFNDACRELGSEHPFVKEWNLGENLSPSLEAYLQLRIVVAALNRGLGATVHQRRGKVVSLVLALHTKRA